MLAAVASPGTQHGEASASIIWKCPARNNGVLVCLPLEGAEWIWAYRHRLGWFVWKSLRVGKSQKALPPQVRAWVEARKQHRLSHAQVQMARELGLNPGKLGKISNHRQEPWKAPLPQFIEYLYLKRFGREQPRVVTPAEKWER
jgi:hypothetical protein